MSKSMSTNNFRAYLRDLQKTPSCLWPNDYFAWVKPDGSLFMVGIRSVLSFHILKYELKKDPFQTPQKRQHTFILPGSFLFSGEYEAIQYSIKPEILQNGFSTETDPVETLVADVSGCRFLGTWRDPDSIMDTPYSKALAQGRWELAREQILKQKTRFF